MAERKLDPLSILTRTNSDCLTIGDIQSARGIDPAVRMEMILRVALAWDENTKGTNTRNTSKMIADNRASLHVYPYVI